MMRRRTNGQPASNRPGLAGRSSSSGRWRNSYCRDCGDLLPRMDRYGCPLAAGLCWHLGQARNWRCLEGYLDTQRRLLGRPRNILLETLHIDYQARPVAFALDVDGRRLRLREFGSRQEAARWVLAQLAPLYEFWAARSAE